MRAAKILALGLLLSLLAVIAFGADGDSSAPASRGSVEAYFPDRQTAAYRSAVSSADTADTETWGSVDAYTLNGRANISVSCRFSGSSGDTATVLVAYYYQPLGGTLTFLGANDATATAGSLIDVNDDNVADTLTFDARGATHCKVLLTSISAGNVDLWVGSF